MNTNEALSQLNVETELRADEAQQLEQNGFFIAHERLDESTCDEMIAAFEHFVVETADEAVDTEPGADRISDIFNKTDAFDAALALQPVLAASAELLGEIKLHGANVRNPHPGEGLQPIHSDVPKSSPEDWRLINALICLDAMTIDNGPTRVVPGSHRWPHTNTPAVNLDEGEEPQGTYGDQSHFPEDPWSPYPGEVLVEAPKGSIVVCNASIWHSGTNNNDGTKRRMLHLTYTRRDLMQQFNQQQHLTRSLWDRLEPAQRFLFDVVEPN